jgi:hypothetical protein
VYLVFDVTKIAREIGKADRDFVKVAIRGFRLYTKLAELFGGTVPANVHLAVKLADALWTLTPDETKQAQQA